ncbi:MAG: cell division protein FtsA [Bacteroidetes bacterium]|jgi:cell division protein FtsA|nr:cell division protein FtsA [Bacteroidota bacterium]MBU2557665.1 cell division protein FtsA [Bacteroidota bacterium]MDA3944403.1 cell division protein FtsA [Bacteroidota bacterium]
MKSSDIIVGLDIGTTKIACLVGRRNENGKIEILGHGKTESIGVKRGVVSNIEDTVNSIRRAVDEASARSGVDIKYVNVGIAGQHIKSLQHRGSLIRENHEQEINRLEIEKLTNDMYKLSMAAGEEIIDVIPQEYIVDGEQGIKQPVGMLGSKLEANFHVIIGQTAAAKNVLKCVTRAGLEMVDLILEPIASAQAVLGDDEKEAGVVLVDIGGGTTDIAIFHDSIIRHTAVIPFGGDIITEDIREGCTIIKKHAEEVKVKFGSSLASENRDDEVVSIPGIRGRAPREISFRNLASIIQARLEEIFEHVYYEIKNSGFERRLIAGIVLTGGGAMMKHIDQLAAFVTGMDVRIGYPNEHLAKDTVEELASPMFATGIGLVIEGIDRHVNEEEVERLKAAADPTQPKPKQKIVPEKKGASYLDKIKKLFDRDLIE